MANADNCGDGREKAYGREKGVLDTGMKMILSPKKVYNYTETWQMHL
jgi:hypothetical protein